MAPADAKRISDSVKVVCGSRIRSKSFGEALKVFDFNSPCLVQLLSPNPNQGHVDPSERAWLQQMGMLHADRVVEPDYPLTRSTLITGGGFEVQGGG